MPLDSAPDSIAPDEYATRADAERKAYEHKTDVHGLPDICFYWLNRYILPQLSSLGFSGADTFFLENIRRAYHGVESRTPAHRTRRFLSIGAGNCDTEIQLAGALRQSGCSDFTIDCLDLNEKMLERGAEVAAAGGLSAHIRPLCADFNYWQPNNEYDAVLANQALHHVVRLEALFDAVRNSLRSRGTLIIGDMIGRNGHRRWPEALGLVEQFWSELPERYRYNCQLSRQENAYPDWDCSTEGFEGIRSQDILPLLLGQFGFEFFYAFSNVTDPFIDRSFGPNFDASADWDRAFIDRVHAMDEAEIRAGRIKPTHMLAVVSPEPSEPIRCLETLTPEFCVRWP